MSIAWRLVHLVADSEIHWEHAFGPARRTFSEAIMPNNVADVIGAHEPVNGLALSPRGA